MTTKKITLDELIEQDLLAIPKADMSFMLSEVIGINYKGLGFTGGIYLIRDIESDEIIYVGVSRDIGKRLLTHKSDKKSKGALFYKLTQKGLSDEEVKNYFAYLEVSILLEDRESYQDIIEKYLIEKHKPKYNLEGIQGKRGGTAMELPVKQIVKEYLAGASTRELGEKYNVGYSTITHRLKKEGVQLRGRAECQLIRFTDKATV